MRAKLVIHLDAASADYARDAAMALGRPLSEIATAGLKRELERLECEYGRRFPKRACQYLPSGWAKACRDGTFHRTEESPAAA